MSSRNNCKTARIICSEYGDPQKVIQLVYEQIPEPSSNELLIEMLMASVNPVDINIIQGVYGPIKPSLPFVPGYEGVGRIAKLGSGVTTFKIGDHVILKNITFVGVWRKYLLTTKDSVIKVSSDLELPEAATLSVNPATAYRMLKDYGNLKPGDTVIQNGANSSCGVQIIQMCKILGLISINVVRNRPEINELKSYLTQVGANYVYTEDEISSINIFKNGDVKKPIMALNCVGGKSASLIMKHLDMDGVMVTYGGMSMQPVTVSTSSLVFKELHFHGFNLSKWMLRNKDSKEIDKMYSDIIDWYLTKKMEVPPYDLVKLENCKEALANTLTKNGMVGKKYILDIRDAFQEK